MLEVTKLLEFASFEPGETIIKNGVHIDTFFLIQSGTVEVVLQGSKKEDITIARLTPGQFFGEIELIRGGKTIANVRAGPEEPVELALLPGAKFNDLLQESPLTREALSQIVQDRIQENRMSDRRRSFLGKLFGGGR